MVGNVDGLLGTRLYRTIASLVETTRPRLPISGFFLERDTVCPLICWNKNKTKLCNHHKEKDVSTTRFWTDTTFPGPPLDSVDRTKRN